MRDSQYLQTWWPVNDEPLNTFGTLKLLFPISKKEFMLVSLLPKCIVLLQNESFIHGIGTSLCFVHIQHIT